MEDIIHLLPDSVANQIAAGEVVQRPSSIIKEMVENSIDAGACNIHVLITDGGKTNVQIVDDGKGMSETDARLAFERHATSKISKASDLFSLTTMGFRGEALASIAAVAQVELKTRRPVDELGTYICIAGSKVDTQEPVNCPIGSNFSVKNLFYNVPARRKFLKSNQTELSNILADFERIVLVNPDINFTLTNNGADMYNLPKASVRQRIVDVCGKKINSELLPIDAETSIISISGYVGKPEASKKKGVKQFFFANGRYMRHPYFHSAVMNAYENLIPVGEHVPYFIYFSVEPSTIDVNVHPTKTEIKFDNEQAIWQVLSAVVKEALGKFCEVPTIDFDVDGKPEIPVFGGQTSIPRQPKPMTTNYNPFNTKAMQAVQYHSKNWEELYNGIDINKVEKEIVDNTIEDCSDSFNIGKSKDTSNFPWIHVASSISQVDNDETVEHKPESGAELDMSHLLDGMRKKRNDELPLSSEISIQCFQFKGRYIVTPVKSGIMIVDQHRAHSRILFEKYMKSIKEQRRASQRELFPDLVEFTKTEIVVLETIITDLEYIGFELTNLGGGSYSINGVPSGLDGCNPVKLLHDLVCSAMENTQGIKEKVQESIALTMANSTSIVYGQALSNVEMEQILHDLFIISSSMRTPDGKIVFTVINTATIDKEF